MLDAAVPTSSSARACQSLLEREHVQAAAVCAARPVVHVDDVQRRRRRRRVLLVFRCGAAWRAAAAPCGLAVGPQAAAQGGVVGRERRRSPVRAARRLSRHLTHAGTGPKVGLQETAHHQLSGARPRTDEHLSNGARGARPDKALVRGSAPRVCVRCGARRPDRLCGAWGSSQAAATAASRGVPQACAHHWPAAHCDAQRAR